MKRDQKGNPIGNPAGKQRSMGTSYDAPFVGYVNLDLTDGQKREFEHWLAGDAFWQAFDAHTADGINLSVKTDPKGAGVLASGTQRRVGSPNAGLVVTARARTAGLALQRVVFVLEVLGSEVPWAVTKPVADPDRW